MSEKTVDFTEGYMYSSRESIKVIISWMKKKHPDFEFNICLASKHNILETHNVDGVTVIPYKIPAYHYWFVMNKVRGDKDEN